MILFLKYEKNEKSIRTRNNKRGRRSIVILDARKPKRITERTNLPGKKEGDPKLVLIPKGKQNVYRSAKYRVAQNRLIDGYTVKNALNIVLSLDERSRRNVNYAFILKFM